MGQLPGTHMQHFPLRDPDDDAGIAARWREENEVLLQLIARAGAGDVDAFERIYNRTARWLLSLVRRLVDDGHAEDVLAEVYIQVWKSLGSYDALRAPPRVWLSVIARSRALDHLRREKRAGQVHGSPEMIVTMEPDDPDSPEQLLSRAEDCQLMRMSLATTDLSADERTVLDLAYFRERTQQEISTLTGLPLATVKTIMGRARDKLRAHIGVAADAVRTRGATP